MSSTWVFHGEKGAESQGCSWDAGAGGVAALALSFPGRGEGQQQSGFLCSVPASDDHGRGKWQEVTVFKPINWLPDR